METTAQITEQYIKDHPAIRSCLKKGLLNYSSFARYLAKELKIEKKTSLEAVLIAARRYRGKLHIEEDHEQKIQKLLSRSELIIRNKIILMITKKDISIDNDIINSVKIVKDFIEENKTP